MADWHPQAGWTASAEEQPVGDVEEASGEEGGDEDYRDLAEGARSPDGHDELPEQPEADLGPVQETGRGEELAGQDREPEKDGRETGAR